MTKPAKPTLAEGKVHSGESSTSQYFLVGNFLLPSNFEIRRAKVPEALPMQQLIYVFNEAFDATLEPRYTIFFTFSISLPSILIDGGIYVP